MSESYIPGISTWYSIRRLRPDTRYRDPHTSCTVTFENFIHIVFNFSTSTTAALQHCSSSGHLNHLCAQIDRRVGAQHSADAFVFWLEFPAHGPELRNQQPN